MSKVPTKVLSLIIVMIALTFSVPAVFNFSQETDYNGFGAGRFAEYQLGNGTSVRFTIESIYENGSINLTFPPNATVIGFGTSPITYYNLLAENVGTKQNMSERYLPSFQALSNFAPWFLDVHQNTIPISFFLLNGWNVSGAFYWSYENGSLFRVSHIGNEYTTHYLAFISNNVRNITIYWEDKYGVLEQVYSNSSLVAQLANQNFWNTHAVWNGNVSYLILLGYVALILDLPVTIVGLVVAVIRFYKSGKVIGMQKTKRLSVFLLVIIGIGSSIGFYGIAHSVAYSTSTSTTLVTSVMGGQASYNFVQYFGGLSMSEEIMNFKVLNERLNMSSNTYDLFYQITTIPKEYNWLQSITWSVDFVSGESVPYSLLIPPNLQVGNRIFLSGTLTPINEYVNISKLNLYNSLSDDLIVPDIFFASYPFYRIGWQVGSQTFNPLTTINTTVRFTDSNGLERTGVCYSATVSPTAVPPFVGITKTVVWDQETGCLFSSVLRETENGSDVGGYAIEMLNTTFWHGVTETHFNNNPPDGYFNTLFFPLLVSVLTFEVSSFISLFVPNTQTKKKTKK